MKPELVILGGTALPMNERLEIIEDSVIEVTSGKISSIKKAKRYEVPRGTKVLDAKGCLVMPGLINLHTHVGMSLLRGIADDKPLEPWLMESIFPLERKFSGPDFVKVGTSLAIAEMLSSGTTTFSDMYYFQDTVAKVVSDLGIRAVCGQTYIEISGVDTSTQSISDVFDAFLEKIHKSPRVIPALAPHSIYGLGKNAWEQIIGYAEKHDLLVHTHLSETKKEVEEAKKKYGMSPVMWFERMGLWKRKAVAAHSVILDESDIETLGKSRVGISHNPESNLKLGSSVCPVRDLRRHGALVGLGTDSTASNNNLDLLGEAATASRLQALRYGVGEVVARDWVKMLTIEAAKALHLDSQIGSLELGKQADVICVSVSDWHARPLYDPYSHLIYGASGQDVRHTIVAGEVLMKDRKLLRVDTDRLASQVTRWEKKIKKER